MKTISQNLLQEITQRLVTEFQPENIFLFGSYAWGVPTNKSDVDLLVIVSESNERPALRASRAYRCLRGLGFPKDILVKTRIEFERFRNVRASLEYKISEKGKILYG